MNRKDIEARLKSVGLADRFIELWWGIKLPGLGGRTPEEVYVNDPEALVRYTEAYRSVEATVHA